MQVKRWGVHACFLDGHCREYGAPRRLHLFAPWGQLIVAMGRDSWTQAWLPLWGYQRWWAPVVWHPSSRKRARWQRDHWRKSG